MDEHLQVKEVSTSSSVDYLKSLSTETQRRLSKDTNQRVTGTVRVYFKSHTSRFTYQFIDQYFDRSDEQNGQRDTSVGQHTSGRNT